MKNIFIVSGPAGSGKDSIIDRLALEIPIMRIITTTTRPARQGERQGQPYYFIPRDEFERGIAAGRFAEYSINENNEYYGVSHQELKRVAEASLPAIWKLDWKGVVNAKKLYPEIPALFIHSSPEEMENRLRRRDGQVKDETYFQERMAYTEEWLKHTDIYDYTIENREGELAAAVDQVRTYIEAHTNGAESLSSL